MDDLLKAFLDYLQSYYGAASPSPIAGSDYKEVKIPLFEAKRMAGTLNGMFAQGFPVGEELFQAPALSPTSRPDNLLGGLPTEAVIRQLSQLRP